MEIAHGQGIIKNRIIKKSNRFHFNGTNISEIHKICKDIRMLMSIVITIQLLWTSDSGDSVW